MAIAVALLVTSCSSATAKSASVWTHIRWTQRRLARELAQLKLLQATIAVTMAITIAAVTGTAATVAGKVVTSGSIRIALNVYAKILRKRNRVQRRAANVVSKASWAMGVATTTTTTVPAIGIVVTAAARAAINGNTRTAPPASVRIRRKKRMRPNAKGTAAVQTSSVTATVMTTTTTAVANTTVVTVVAKMALSGNIHTVLCASAWTRINSDQSA